MRRAIKMPRFHTLAAEAGGHGATTHALRPTTAAAASLHEPQAAQQPGGPQQQQPHRGPPCPRLEELVQRLRVPWGPMLTRKEAARGIGFYGSGERLHVVAEKLLAGQPIKVRLGKGL